MISAEAPVLFSKAAEIFISELSLRAWIHTEENKRRTLQVPVQSLTVRIVAISAIIFALNSALCVYQRAAVQYDLLMCPIQFILFWLLV